MNKIEIKNKDCIVGLQDLEDNSIDLIVTDPPYILNNSLPGKSSIKYLDKIKLGLKNIEKGFDIDLHLKEWKRVLKKFNAFIFCSNKQLGDLIKWGENNNYIVTTLIWHKYNAPPLCNGNWIGDIEYIVHIREIGSIFQGNNKIKNKVDRIPINKMKYGHPTEKPLSLINKYILVGSLEGQVVLDPFLGSGTTCESCINYNRNFIGFEIDENYYKMAYKRLKNMKKQGSLKTFIK